MHAGSFSTAGTASGQHPSPAAAPLPCAGFGRFQWLLLLYTGLAWLADACEIMLLSFLGPAVRYAAPAAQHGARPSCLPVPCTGAA